MWTLLLVTRCLLRLLLYNLFVAHYGSIAMHLPGSAVYALINAEVIHEMYLILTKVLMLGRFGACRGRDHLGCDFLAIIGQLILHLHLTRSVAHEVPDLRNVVRRPSASDFLAPNDPRSSLLLNLALGGFLGLFADQVGCIAGPLDDDRIVHVGGLRRVLLAGTYIAGVR